jgi:hypothetical protein
VVVAAAKNGLVVAGLSTGGLAVVDVSDPTRPVERKVMTGFKGLRDVALYGSTAYVLSDKLTLLDLRKPDDPTTIGGYESQDPLLALALHYDHPLLVTRKGLLLMNLSVPDQPVRLDAVLNDTLIAKFGDAPQTPDKAAVKVAANDASTSPPAAPATPTATAKAPTPAPSPAAASTGTAGTAGATPTAATAPAPKAPPEPVLELGVPRAIIADDRLLVSRGEAGAWLLGLDGGKTLTPLGRLADVTSAIAAVPSGSLEIVGTAEGELVVLTFDGQQFKRLASLKVAEAAAAVQKPAGPSGMPAGPGTLEGQKALSTMPDATPGPRPGAPGP